ncbi:MAG TPA: Asp23/Gls24 family envelope stress response protein [Acidimicrobiia bacterium]|jgi:hypothetical protein
MTGSSAQVTDGVDLDAVSAAVRSCPAVEDLDGGATGSVVTYLPGRQILGLRVDRRRLTIQVRGRWGVPVAELARQVTSAVAGLARGRRIDIVVSDISTPNDEATADLPSTMTDGGGGWTATSAGNDARSSARTTPTPAGTPPTS